MSQMTPEVSKLLERALSLSVEEQKALADSLILNLGGKVDEGVTAAGSRNREAHPRARFRQGKTVPWEQVRNLNLAKLPRAHPPLSMRYRASTGWNST